MLRACVVSPGGQRAEALARQRRRSLQFIGRRAGSGAGVAVAVARPADAPCHRQTIKIAAITPLAPRSGAPPWSGSASAAGSLPSGPAATRPPEPTAHELRSCAETWVPPANNTSQPSRCNMLTTAAGDSVTSKTPTTAHTGIWIQSPMPRPCRRRHR